MERFINRKKMAAAYVLSVAVFSFVIFWEMAVSVASANELCSQEMGSQADSSLVNASNSWAALQKHHGAFSACEDGALAEGYSEAVVQLFSRKWVQLGAFSSLAASDAEFRSWALRHIDATGSIDDLKMIVENANRCAASGVDDLCDEIGNAARKALKELSEINN